MKPKVKEGKETGCSWKKPNTRVNKRKSAKRKCALQLSHSGSCTPQPARPAGTNSTLISPGLSGDWDQVWTSTHGPGGRGGGNQKSTQIYYNIKLLPPLLPLDKSHIHQGRQKLCHLNISHNIYFNYFFLGVSAVTVQSFQRQLI